MIPKSRIDHIAGKSTTGIKLGETSRPTYGGRRRQSMDGVLRRPSAKRVNRSTRPNRQRGGVGNMDV